MSLVRTVRKVWRSRRFRSQPAFVRTHDELYRLTRSPVRDEVLSIVAEEEGVETEQGQEVPVER